MPNIKTNDGRTFELALLRGDPDPSRGGPCGEGVLQSSWRRYDGTLSDGRPDGEGELVFPRSSLTYRGTFRNGKLHGEACVVEHRGHWSRSGAFRFGFPVGACELMLDGGVSWREEWSQLEEDVDVGRIARSASGQPPAPLTVGMIVRVGPRPGSCAARCEAPMSISPPLELRSDFEISPVLSALVGKLNEHRGAVPTDEPDKSGTSQACIVRGCREGEVIGMSEDGRTARVAFNVSSKRLARVQESNSHAFTAGQRAIRKAKLLTKALAPTQSSTSVQS